MHLVGEPVGFGKLSRSVLPLQDKEARFWGKSVRVARSEGSWAILSLSMPGENRQNSDTCLQREWDFITED